MPRPVQKNRRRSKGCDQCRKRRVKCDETPEFCRQCLRFGLDCSGLVQGFMVVDMTQNVSAMTDSNMQQRVLQSSETQVHPFGCHIEEPLRKSRDIDEAKLEISLHDADSLSQLGHDDVEDSKPLKWATYLPSIHQPYSLEAFEQGLILQFMDYARPNRIITTEEPWLLSIPDILSESIIPAFKYSIRAAAIAFHAFLHQDLSAKEVSCRWYITSLNIHQKFLSYSASYTDIDDEHHVRIPGSEEILVPVFLCLFEVVSCATSEGCYQHLNAACKILQIRGPKNCQTGMYHQLFKFLRAADVCISIICNKPSLFAAQDWLTLPFIENERPALHQLIDIMLSIPLTVDPLSQFDSLPELINQHSTTKHYPKSEVHSRCYELLEQLQCWWSDVECSYEPNIHGCDRSHMERPPLSQSPFIYRDTFTAFTVSMYNSTCLILHRILYNLSQAGTGQSSRHLEQASSHANSVLRISEYQQLRCPIGFDFMRSSFSLVVFGMVSPEPEQRLLAMEIKKRWNSMGLSGILVKSSC